MAHGMLDCSPLHPVTVLAEPSLAGMGATFQKTLHKDVLARELFPTPEPEIGQVNQQNIGDCWYLASVIAILSRPNGHAWIKRMMVDNRDGTVTVRLYDVAGEPHYIRVRKSLAMGAPSMIHGKSKYHSSGGLWMAMLEKALTAFDREGRFDPTRASYQRTQGNTSLLAFSMLLGYDRNVHVFEDPIDDPKARPHTDYGVSFPSQRGWHARTQGQWERLVATARKNQKVIRRDQFTAFVEKALTEGEGRVDPQAQVDMSRRIAREFAGKRMTGQYSSLHERFFTSIEFATERNQPIVAYTRETVGRTQTLLGRSANEPISKGLAGNHAYAVFGAVEQNHIKYILVYNPWGQKDGGMGREYDEQGHAQRGSSALSKLELDDFIKRFSHVRLANPVTREHLANQIRKDRTGPERGGGVIAL